MTTLEDFGVDVPDAEPDSVQEDSGGGWLSRENSRCPAINDDGTRCGHPKSRMNDHEPYCGVHGEMEDLLTIHDDPRKLIRWLGRNAARCRANQHNGERCPNSCGALNHYCGTHENWSHGRAWSDDLADDELDGDLIHEALEAVAGGDDGGD